MRRLIPTLILTATFAVTAAAQPRENATDLLRRVEARYNSIKTMQASFTQIDTVRNRPKPPQKGTLYMRKQPNSTLWEYTAPAGDFFLSSGKFTYLYEKATGIVSREPFKETEDSRIPLSFLLGKLDFDEHFGEFRDRPDPAGTIVEMLPKKKNLEFEKITLVVTPDATIRRVIVLSQGGLSSIEYVLESQQINPKLSDTLFQFKTPAGATVVDLH